MIISWFECSGLNGGYFYGIFDDKNQMKEAYEKIKTECDENEDEIDYYVGKCYYKSNRKTNQIFRFSKSDLVLVKPMKGIKYDIELGDEDELSSQDRLLVMLDTIDENNEIECVYLVRNKYSYSECFNFTDVDQFKKHNPKIDISGFMDK